MMTSEAIGTDAKLYDLDYNLWLEKTIGQLRDRAFTEIDLENLLEELEAMGRSEKRAVYSNLKILLMHLLKYRYQPDRRSNSWRSTIREHRQRLTESFQESPSLKGYSNNVFDACYQKARELAADETGLDIEAFPDESPFSIAETLDSEYLPN
ncbi:MAG: DUF29 domain-containing protein [Hormoscilla sp.]